MDAMKLLEQYAEVDGKSRFHGEADTVPMDGVVRKDWHEALVDDRGRPSGSRTGRACWRRCGT
ncbi:hypothetical protein [Streptosporangium sp. NPDC004631]